MSVQAIRTVGEECAQFANRSLSNAREAINYLIPDAMLNSGKLSEKGADILDLSLKTAELPQNTPIQLFIKYIRNKAEALQISREIAQETKSAEFATKIDEMLASLPESIQKIIKDFDEKKMEFSRLLYR